MQVKKIIKKGGRYMEEYVDMGPGRAREGHGLPRRAVRNQHIGPARRPAAA